MTYDIDDYYGVTIGQAQAGKPYIAVGQIYLRRTMANVGIQVRGEGRTWPSATQRALQQARAKCPVAPPDAD